MRRLATRRRRALLVEAETLRAFSKRVDTLAKEPQVTRGCKLRTDGTVVEANIAYPRDSKLSADGVRLLCRTIRRAEEVIIDKAGAAAQTFRDGTRGARNQARRIANCTHRKNQVAKEGMRKAYRRSVGVARAAVRQARTVMDVLK